MMYWNGDWSWAAWLAMTASMLAFWALVAWAVLAMIRRPADASGRATPEEVLAERFARGEVDEDEYMRRRRILRER